jgi:hypothetical protein
MPAAIDSPSSHRALVALAAAADPTHSYRPLPPTATFLAQLIATAQKLPQARARRRAEPAEAIAAYRTTIELTHKLNRQS